MFKFSDTIFSIIISNKINFFHIHFIFRAYFEAYILKYFQKHISRVFCAYKYAFPTNNNNRVSFYND